MHAQAVRRVTQPVNDAARVTLSGNVHPLAQARYDRGAVADSLPAQRMLLLLRRSPEQESALARYLENAHTPGNASYHQWLTPEQFGRLYGPNDADVAAVAAWLGSHGFAVARVTAGKTAIEFSGSAGQVRDAFHTEIHTYAVNGVEHHANNRDPQIPAALAAVVAGITPLNDFRPRSNAVVLGQATYDVRTHAVAPQWTFGPGALALGPGDFALQYDVNPLYQAGTNGSGVTIGIIGASNIDPAVAATYRSLFGLAANPVKVIVDGSDPGENGAEVESYLDVEVAGSVAPGASIDLYTAAGTTVQSGLVLAAQRAVDEDAATVLSMSYGACEQELGAAGNAFWAAVWEQAAAQGQTALVSAGDGGAAGCDDFDEPQAAQDGLAVNGFGSTPWNLSVGGTDFYYSSYNQGASAQSTQLATYWNLTPSLTPTVSLLKPVPEQPWNRAFGLDLYDKGSYNPNDVTIVAGSGGASSCTQGTVATNGSYSACTGGYAKPAWQKGNGVPADGVRDLPDVALFAAAGEDESFYPICSNATQCIVQNGDMSITGAGGTSASTPAMAGILALINQKYGAQGQAAFVLYPLAAQHPAVFHDVTVGSNVVPCQQGTPNCAQSTQTDNTGGFYTLGQYYAGKGYDQASGLGSVDANLLAQYWNSLKFDATTTTLSLSQTSFTHGTPVDVNVAVSGNGGTPTGDVALVTTAAPAVNTGLGPLTLTSGAAGATVNDLPGGQYALTAHYGGDTSFAGSTSSAVNVDVSPEASTVSVSGNYYEFNFTNPNSTIGYQPVTDGASYPYGTYVAVDAQPRGVHAPQGALDGIPTGTATFSDAASTGAASSGALAINRQGMAEWGVVPGFTAGTHSVSASYSGDGSFEGSSSGTPLTFTVTKGTTLSLVSAQPLRIALGSSTVITAELGILPSVVVAPPTGTVTFSSAGKQLGTVALAAQQYSPGFSTATLNVSGLPLGQNVITVQYGGDANFTAATGTVTVGVAQPAGLTASASPNPANQAQNFTVTGTVTGVKGLPAPSGGLFFFATDTAGNSWSAGGQFVNGSASFVFDGWNFVPGTVTVQVEYAGDANYGPAQTVVPVTITVPYSLSATPVTMAPGATTGNTSNVSVMPEGGFTGTVYLSCALATSPQGAQYLPGCSLPATVNLTGTSAATLAMTITSTAASRGALTWPAGRWWTGGGGVLAVALLFGFPGAGWKARRPQRWLASTLVVVATIGGGLAGCGSGGGSTGPTIAGTTPGTYTFTVTASFTATLGASLPQTATATVTIQ